MKSLLISSPGRCGMHWLARILRNVLPFEQCPTRRWREMMGDINYGQLYLTHDPVAYFVPIMEQVNCIAMVRDPRDMIVSVAHYLAGPARDDWKRVGMLWGTKMVEGISFEEALVTLKRDGHNSRWFSIYLEIPMPHFIVRYEDLYQRPQEVIEHLLRDLGYGSSHRTWITKALEAASFERVSDGRQRGEEDPSHFYRKGIVGDWHNYFTDEENLEFQSRFSEIFRVFGYD